jgi:predicted O-methyltransferase YrrM
VTIAETAPTSRLVVAADAGFTIACDDAVGRLLAVLAATVPRNGRILELGTGTGVGLAWLVAGLATRHDAAVTSVEANPSLAARARSLDWPGFVEIRVGDARGVLEQAGAYDLIFADAPTGKTNDLELTLARLSAGGLLIVDDMLRKPNDPYQQQMWPRLLAVRDTLLCDPRLVSAELSFASGVIISTRTATSDAAAPGRDVDPRAVGD